MGEQPCAAGGFTTSTRILRADNGSETSLSALVESGEQPLVWSLDSSRRLIAAQVTGVHAEGAASAARIRLASGRVLEASSESDVIALNGSRRLGDVMIGDRIAAPRRVSEPLAPQEMDDDELVLLAHMIGDGSCVKNQPIRYASIDEQNLLAVTNAAQRFGVTAVRDDYPAARVTTLRLPAPYRLTHGKRNPIAAWLDGHGLFGKRSYEKFVPTAVFAAPDHQIAWFLRHLWSTDGCVKWQAQKGNAKVYYASTSRRLVDDVMQLLLRLGVSARIYRIPQGRYRDSWHLDVQGAANQTRFLNIVGMHGAKYFDAKKVLFNLADVKSNANVDTVPRGSLGPGAAGAHRTADVTTCLFGRDADQVLRLGDVETLTKP